MRLVVSAIGRVKDGPEAELIEDYRARAIKLGRPLGFMGFDIVEAEARQAGDQTAEAPLLLKPVPQGAVKILLDERGEPWSSAEIAARLARWRDQGAPAACFLIGGPNGTAPSIGAGCAHALAFGRQTWPHKLARVMLAEQIYRAISILAGAPYHRD